MLQTFLVYLTLYIGLLIFAKYIKKNNKKINIPLYCSLLFFSFIVGMRWMVGLDYPNYYDFIMGNYAEWDFLSMEFFPSILAEFLRENNIPFYFWFIIMAFIQFYFLTKAFVENKKFLIAWAFFLFLALFLEFSLNVVRQAVAIFIVFYSYKHICDKKLFKYILFIILASLFHRSAILCLPLYFIGKFENIFNVKVQLLIFIVLLLLGGHIYTFFLSIFSSFAEVLQYADQFESMKENQLKIQEGSGLGVIFNCFRYFILIIYSKVLFEKYSDLNFHTYYNLLFIGICFYLIYRYDIYFSRIILYFTVCELVVLSLYLYDSFTDPENEGQPIIASSILFVQILIILNFALNGDWKFVWDVGKF